MRACCMNVRARIPMHRPRSLDRWPLIAGPFARAKRASAPFGSRGPGSLRWHWVTPLWGDLGVPHGSPIEGPLRVRHLRQTVSYLHRITSFPGRCIDGGTHPARRSRPPGSHKHRHAVRQGRRGTIGLHVAPRVHGVSIVRPAHTQRACNGRHQTHDKPAKGAGKATVKTLRIATPSTNPTQNTELIL